MSHTLWKPEFVRMQKTCLFGYSGKQTLFKSFCYCSPGHWATNKPAGCVHVPYARGHGVCQPEEGCQASQSSIQQTHWDQRSGIWPGSQCCSVFAVFSIQTRKNVFCFFFVFADMLDYNQAVDQIIQRKYANNNPKQCSLQTSLFSFSCCLSSG